MINRNYIQVVKRNGETILIHESYREVIVKGIVKCIRYKESLVLKMLVESYPAQVSRKVLSDSVWGATYVFDETINQTVKNLRIALDDKNKEIITTIPRFGYSFGIKPIYNKKDTKKITHARLKMDIKNLRTI
ncbi:MAG: winged helix-turn-helix domain-containing protein [Enterovibrio sp.]